MCIKDSLRYFEELNGRRKWRIKKIIVNKVILGYLVVIVFSLGFYYLDLVFFVFIA